MATKEKKPQLASVSHLLSQFTRRAGAVVDVNMLDHAETNMTRYGFETVLNRALPDYRDGCIPVRRMILWAMQEVHNTSGNKRQKSAKPVGNVIANYHPHGDISVYGAIVSMVNSPDQMLDGEGNWGGPTSGPAALRYTNVRTSKYVDSIMFNKRFLNKAVLDMVPNYDGTTVQPILLPALLPNLLINGLDAGIGVGVSGCTPPFKKAGVKELVRRWMIGETITPKLCYQTLEFNYTTGCTLFTDDDVVIEKLGNFFKTGRGSAMFVPNHTIDRAGHALRITGTAPMINALNIIEQFGLNEKGKDGKGKWDFIQSADETTDKNSGGLLIEIGFKTPSSNNEFNEWCNKVIDQFANQINYQINVVETFVNEKGKGDARFRRFTLVELINAWCTWRVELEMKALRNEHVEESKLLRQNELKLQIARNPDAFVRALRSDDEVAAISTLLKCSSEEADWLLERPVRTLTKASEAKIAEALALNRATLEQIKGDLANPKDRIVRDLVDL